VRSRQKWLRRPLHNAARCNSHKPTLLLGYWVYDILLTTTIGSQLTYVMCIRLGSSMQLRLRSDQAGDQASP